MDGGVGMNRAQDGAFELPFMVVVDRVLRPAGYLIQGLVARRRNLPTVIKFSGAGGCQGPVDALVGATAAKMTCQSRGNGAAGGCFCAFICPPLFEESDTTIDQAGRTKPALEGIVLHEGKLDRMQVARVMELDGLHLPPGELLDRQQAGSHRRPVDENRAGAANPGTADEFGAGQSVATQQIDNAFVGMGRLPADMLPVNGGLNHLVVLSCRLPDKR